MIGTFQLSEQFFSDERMLVVAVAAFALMFGIGAVLVYWRDSDVVWVAAFDLIQLLPILYYFRLWESPDTPITLFPETNLLIRPALASFWALVISYSLVRLSIKRDLRTRKK